MDYPKESLDRQKKIADMQKAGIICYANKFENKQDIADIINISKNDTQGGHLRDIDNLMNGGCIGEFGTAGRIISSRSMGKLTFAKIRDNSSDIQVCFSRGSIKLNTGRKIVEEIEIGGEMKTAYKVAEKYAQVGDYIGVVGDLFETKHGELTIFVKEIQILSKAVRPLPEKYHGITDKESIYRQRYLDLIMNQDSYDRFLFRSKFVKALRDFYEKNNFIEIETPVLGNSASGAAAQPFITHHNDFDSDFFLRIAPETALKKATVGRFERVFEIGKNYRNEGSDPSHMQEFTAVEHYAAYWNFEDNMKFTEEMFDFIFDKMKLDKKIKIKDKDGIEKEVDFTTPFERIDYIAGVKAKSGIDISNYGAGDEEKLRVDILKAGYKWEGMDKQAVATMIDYLYKKVLRPSIVGPVFVYNYPKTMQPLARESDENENIVEQFQLVLNGWEVLKAYSELVDPKKQQEKFDEQSGAIEMGDEEATSGDDDFVLAMEYAMPPQSGWGMGIDRIVSLLTNQDNLRDVVLFPLMKSDDNVEKKEKNNNSLLNSLPLQGKEEQKSNNYAEVPSREDVLGIVDKYASATKQHLLQVGAVMEHFAEKLGEDKDYWWTVGVLHDIDWDYIEKNGEKHCKQDLEKICNEINVAESIVKDIKSHAFGLVPGITEQPDSLVRKYLASVDELSGFMWAYFRMLPSDNPMDIKPKSIKKKIKDKSFASGISREELKNCEKYLNINLDEFIEDIKLAFSKENFEK